MSAGLPLLRTAEDRGVWERVLSPFGAELAERAGELSRLLLDRLVSQLPELYPDPESVEANRASAEASIRTIAEHIRGGADPHPIELPPETVAYARASARRGLAIASLLRTYRLAQAALWDWIVEELVTRSHDRQELARAIEICAAWIFAYVDTALILAEEIYASERERFARSAAAIRAETIGAILEGRETDPRAAGLRLRYELDRKHVGICAWLERAPADADTDTDTDTDTVELVELAIVETGRAVGVEGVLLHPLGLLDAAGWISSASQLDLGPLERLRLDETALPGIRVAVGEPGHGIAGFRSTHFEALNARRVATLSRRAAGSVTRFGPVSLQALAIADLDQARAFVHRELGALAADDDTSRRLAATLRAYLDEHASRSRAAKRLGIHENTISYRIRQAEEILGRSVEEDTLNLRVALALAALTREPAH